MHHLVQSLVMLVWVVIVVQMIGIRVSMDALSILTGLASNVSTHDFAIETI